MEIQIEEIETQVRRLRNQRDEADQRISQLEDRIAVIEHIITAPLPHVAPEDTGADDIPSEGELDPEAHECVLLRALRQSGPSAETTIEYLNRTQLHVQRVEGGDCVMVDTGYLSSALTISPPALLDIIRDLEDAGLVTVSRPLFAMPVVVYRR